METFKKDLQYVRFCAYGFLKNLRFYEPFLMAYLLIKLPDNYSQIGILYTVRFMLRFLLEIPSGIIADALGRKSSLIFSYCFYIASFLGYYFAYSFYTLLIPTVLFGIADAFRTGTHKAMIIDYLSIKGWKDQKTEYYGHTRSWSQTGSAISSLLVFIFFAIKPAYDFIFLITTLPYILGLANILTYPGYLSEIKKNSKEGNIKKILLKYKEAFSALKENRSIIYLSGTSLFFGYYQAIKDYLQPIILASGLIAFLVNITAYNFDNAHLIPLIYFAIFLLSTIASRNAAVANRIFKSEESATKTILFIGSIIGALAGYFYLINLHMMSMLCFILIFVLINIQRPNVVSMVSGRYNRSNMATILSVESQLGSITAGAVALITGILADRIGLPLALTISSFGVFLSGIIIWLPQYEKNRQENP